MTDYTDTAVSDLSVYTLAIFTKPLLRFVTGVLTCFSGSVWLCLETLGFHRLCLSQDTGEQGICAP